MKQYTTPSVTIRFDGQDNLLAAADRVVVCVSSDDGESIISGDRLEIDGDKISFTMTVEETAKAVGVSKVEATVFCGELVYKSKTMKMKTDMAVWDNGTTVIE